jgi:predicted transcriptional regulator
MHPDLEPLDAVSSSIRRLRTAAGISQKKLARMSGLSQSTIARIERDIVRLNPSYQTIFTVMDVLRETSATSATGYLLRKRSGEIMHRDIVSLRPEDTLEKAIGVIKDYDFPQLPVISGTHAIVGTVSQNKILAIATQNPEKIPLLRIREVMDEALPRVGPNTEVAKLKPILENFNAVLVVEGSKAVGIITIYDVLKLLG